MDSRFFGVAICVCVCAVGDAGSGIPSLLQPVGRRDDEGLQPANEIVDHTNVHFHSRSHIHPTRRKLGVVNVWRDQGNRLYGVGIISTVLFACAVAVTWKTTWEMTPEQAGFGEYANSTVHETCLGLRGWIRRAAHVIREYATTLRIREFRKHLVIFLLVQTSSDVFGQTFLFFVLYDWSKTAAFASLLLGCTVVSLPLMPLFGKAVVKFGVRRLYAFAFAGMLLGVAWLALAWVLTGALPSAVWMVLAVAASLWFFVFKALVGYLPWTVLVFMPDIDQIVTRRYRSATFSSVQSSLRQLGSGIVTIGVGLVLAMVGFDSSLPRQSREASIGIAAVMLGFYTVAMIVCWIVSSRLAINQRTDFDVLHEVDRLRAGGDKTEVDASVRRTVERLTGLSYEECWK